MAKIYKRINELIDIGAILDTDEMEIDRASQDETKKITIAAIKELIGKVSINNVNDSDYTILDDDNYTEIWIDPATADRDAKFPTPADNINRKLRIRNVGNGTNKVICKPDSGEKFNVFSGNKEWALVTFELLQAGDFVDFISDGTNWIKDNEPYWHMFGDPDTGTHTAKVAGWAADEFTPGGMEVTFSEAPIGSLAVRCAVNQFGTQSIVFYRKSGDANISNTPNASNENSHRILQPDDDVNPTVLWMSDDLKIQIAVTNTATDINVYYPIEYLQ